MKRGEILLGEHTDMLLVLSGTVYFERAETAGAQRRQTRGDSSGDETNAEDSSESSSSEDSSGNEEPFGGSVEQEGYQQQATADEEHKHRPGMTFRKQPAGHGRGKGPNIPRINKIRKDMHSKDRDQNQAQPKTNLNQVKHKAPKDRRLSLLKRAQASIIQNAKSQPNHRLRRRNQQIQKSLSKVSFLSTMTKFTNPTL